MMNIFKMSSLTVVLWFFNIWIFALSFGQDPPPSGKLLVILFDGFRWDYVNKHEGSLPNFRRLKEKGAHAESLKPDFPSLSIPNHYSIMTGLHTGHHGMTGNFMFDYRNHSKFQLLTTNEGKMQKWWEMGEPLWITAVKQGKRSSMYRWRGCEIPNQGVSASDCLPFTTNVSPEMFDSSIDEVFRLFADNKTDIAGVYSDIVDVTGHWYGPDSPQLAAALRATDQSIGKILDLWTQAVKEDILVNVMIFSDHGMTTVSPERLINVTGILTPDLWESIAESGPVMSVYTPIGDTAKEKEVLAILNNYHQHMKCYSKDSLPRQWHYATGKFVAPVTCVADLGWFILHPLQPWMWERKSDKKLIEGEHGYELKYKDMWAIFYGLGPAFIPGSSVHQINVVDLYPVMCRLAGLEPQTPRGVYDGRGSHVNSLLKQEWRVNKSRGLKPVTVLIISLALCVLFISR